MNIVRREGHGILFSGLVSFFAFLLIIFSSAEAETLEDYKLKAAFIYKFILFTDWPADILSNDTGTITLGIVGSNPFGNIFEQVTDRKVKGRNLVIRYLSRNPPASELCRCHVVFISATVKNRVREILKKVSSCPVLTISDIRGFAETGGMIEFRIKRNRLRFIINNREACEAGITFRAQMLQLAIEVKGQDVGKKDHPDSSHHMSGRRQP